MNNNSMESDSWPRVKVEPSDDSDACGGNGSAAEREMDSSTISSHSSVMECDFRPKIKVEPCDNDAAYDYEGARVVNEDPQPEVGGCGGNFAAGEEGVKREGSPLPAERSAPAVEGNLMNDDDDDNSMDVQPAPTTWPEVKVEIDVADSGFPDSHSQAQCPHEIMPAAGASSEEFRTTKMGKEEFLEFRAMPGQLKHHEDLPMDTEEQTLHVQVKKEPDSLAFGDDGAAPEAETAAQQMRSLLHKSVTEGKSGTISENPHQSVSHSPAGPRTAKRQPPQSFNISQSRTQERGEAENTQAATSVRQADHCSARAEDDELESLPIHFLSRNDGKTSGTQTSEPACVSNEFAAKLYGCNVCFEAFSSAEQLQQHMVNHSVAEGEKSVRCGRCGKVYERCSRLKEHTVIHTGDKSYQCEQCPSRFARKTTLTRHKRQVHSGQKQYQCQNGKGMFECELCHKTFVCSQGLKTHLIRHSDDRPFQCDECPASFKLASCLKRHKGLHSGVRPFKCESCPAAFSQSFNLSQHVKSIHSNDRPFKCELCPARFKIASDVKRHQRVHALDKPYKCDLCPAEFSSSTSLHRHKNVHTSNRPFKCDQCSAQFQHATDLKSHQEIHSNNDGLKCDQCSARFKNAAYLKSHKRIHNHVKIKGRRSKEFLLAMGKLCSKPGSQPSRRGRRPVPK